MDSVVAVLRWLVRLGCPVGAADVVDERNALGLMGLRARRRKTRGLKPALRAADQSRAALRPA